MTLKEQMAQKRQAKLNKKIARSKKVTSTKVQQPLLEALKDLAYKLNNNKLTVGDTYNLLLLFQHTYFIQAICKDASWNWLGVKYLNKIKLSIKNILNSIIDKHCTVINDNYNANPNEKLTVYKQTRQKLLWFILRVYDKTYEVFNMSINVMGYKQKMAKYILYAKEMVNMDLAITQPRLMNLIDYRGTK